MEQINSYASGNKVQSDATKQMQQYALQLLGGAMQGDQEALQAAISFMMEGMVSQNTKGVLQSYAAEIGRKGLKVKRADCGCKATLKRVGGKVINVDCNGLPSRKDGGGIDKFQQPTGPIKHDYERFRDLKLLPEIPEAPGGWTTYKSDGSPYLLLSLKDSPDGDMRQTQEAIGSTLIPMPVREVDNKFSLPDNKLLSTDTTYYAPIHIGNLDFSNDYKHPIKAGHPLYNTMRSYFNEFFPQKEK